MADGSNTAFFLHDEAVYGTIDNPATLQVPVKFRSIDIEKSQNTFEDPTIDGSTDELQDMAVGTSTISNGFAQTAEFGELDTLLEALMMDAWGGGDVLQISNTRRSFSITKVQSDITEEYEVFTGMEVNTLDIRASLDNYVELTWGFVGQTAATLTATPPTGWTEDTSPGTGEKISTYAGSFSANAVSTPITEFSLSMTRNLEPEYVLFSEISDGDAAKGDMMATGSFTAKFDDATLYNRFLANTEDGLIVRIQGASNGYTMEMGRVRYTAVSKAIQGKGRILASFSFTALQDSGGTGTTIEITRGTNP